MDEDDQQAAHSGSSASAAMEETTRGDASDVPRLQRLYMSQSTAKYMGYHARPRNNKEVMVHPSDGETWKKLDKQFRGFAEEVRNIRLCLATDGFTPFGISAASYSCWPVFVVPYNLPPVAELISTNWPTEEKDEEDNIWPTVAELISTKPDDFGTDDGWRLLCEHWSTQESRNNSLRGKRNRLANGDTIYHCSRARSIVATRQYLKQKTGKDPGLVSAWQHTHRLKRGNERVDMCSQNASDRWGTYDSGHGYYSDSDLYDELARRRDRVDQTGPEPGPGSNVGAGDNHMEGGINDDE